MTKGESTLLQTIERFEAAEQRLDERIREANSAGKALREIIRDGDEMVHRLQEATRLAVRDTFWLDLQDEIMRLTEELYEDYGKHRDEAVERITASFDELKDILLGEGKESKGRPSIPDLARAKAAMDAAAARPKRVVAEGP